MKKHKIPTRNQDLRRYAAWKNWKYLLSYVAYLLFFALAFWFYLNRRHEDARPLAWWAIPLFAIIVIISGWLICCMYRFVGDFSLSGRIQSIAFTRSYDRGLTRSAGLSIDEHTYIKITVMTKNGKKRRVRVMLFDDGYDGYYYEGATLVKYRGLNYPLCLESEKNGAHLCSVCGVRTFYKEGQVIDGEAQPEIQDGLIVCRSCRHKLIDINDLRNGD